MEDTNGLLTEAWRFVSAPKLEDDTNLFLEALADKSDSTFVPSARRRSTTKAIRHLERRDEGTPGFVYLISEASGLVKIGKSKNPENRLASIRSGNPTMRILAVIETKDMHGVEKALHRRFTHKRAGGEWYQMDLEQILGLLI